jgi:hypothetical protein
MWRGPAPYGTGRGKLAATASSADLCGVRSAALRTGDGIAVVRHEGLRQAAEKLSRAVILRACDFFRLVSVARRVEEDGEGRGVGWR